MKLSPLNGRIRKAAEAVKIKIAMPDGGEPLIVNVQKSSLLDSLKERFEGIRTIETGLTLDDDDVLMFEQPVIDASQSDDGSTDDDEEIDLLGDAPAEEDDDDFDLLA